MTLHPSSEVVMEPEPVTGSTPESGEAVVAPTTFCAVCGAEVPRPKRGRQGRYCSPAHRAAAALRRQRGLPENFPLVEANTHGRRRLGVADPVRRS